MADAPPRGGLRGRGAVRLVRPDAVARRRGLGLDLPAQVTDCYLLRRASSYKAIAPVAATFSDSAPRIGIVASTSRETAASRPSRSAPSRNVTRPERSTSARS